MWSRKPIEIPTAEEALPGRAQPPHQISGVHAVNGNPIVAPFPEGSEQAYVGMGCFWGAERLFWSLPGVIATAVGYQGGHTPHPTYEEVCSGRTGHTEAVLVVFDPDRIGYLDLLEVFFTEHDPTQGMRQGNDVGTQYRSAIYWTTPDQERQAREATDTYAKALADAGRGAVSTELAPADTFFYAEEPHQQYLHKVPNGYCGLQGTGISCNLGARGDEGSASEPTSTDTERDPALKPLAASEEEWRDRLSPEQFEVLRQSGTERAFTGVYTDEETPGLYRCAACGNPLHRSEDKFHSGCGWPSFTHTISPDATVVIEDRSHGMVRTEVRCGRCQSHLGHLFPDGPPDRGGMRYCINSLAMDLEPAEPEAP